MDEITGKLKELEVRIEVMENLLKKEKGDIYEGGTECSRDDIVYVLDSDGNRVRL